MRSLASQHVGLRASRGFTLLELLSALAICGLLAGVAVPTYRAIVERQKTQTAIRDLAEISMRIERYFTNRFEYPESLEDIGAHEMRDPWGNPYRYLSFDADIPGINGKIRKDHNLHPINSNFDLYSVGPDGESRAPLTARHSRDDIVYARDGGFIGPAEDF